MNQNGNVRRIGNFTAALMLIVAFLVDVLQVLLAFLNVIPGAGIMFSFFVSVVAGVLFMLWFGLSNVSYSSGKKAVAKFLTTIASMTIEFTGLLSALPMMSVNVAAIIVLSRIEDAEAAREKEAAAARRSAIEARREEAAARQAANDNAEPSEARRQAA